MLLSNEQETTPGPHDWGEAVPCWHPEWKRLIAYQFCTAVSWVDMITGGKSLLEYWNEPADSNPADGY